MATIEELEQRFANLEAKLATNQNSGLPSDPGAQSPPVENGGTQNTEEQTVYTWDQLRQAVDENKISESVAHQIWADQTRRLAVLQAKQEITAEVTSSNVMQKVASEIDKYRDAIPAIMDSQSEQRQRVVREFARLTGELGYPKDDLRTELVALQSAFGPISEVARAVNTKDQGSRDVSSDEEPSADDEKDSDPASTAPSSLSADEKRYYQDAINKGIYRSWGDVREELKFSNKRVRRRYGARV